MTILAYRREEGVIPPKKKKTADPLCWPSHSKSGRKVNPNYLPLSWKEQPRHQQGGGVALMT